MLVEAVEAWTRTLAAAVGHPPPAGAAGGWEREKGTRPLTELAFWRARSGTLSALWEQLNTPRVRGIVAALQLGEEPCVDPFRGPDWRWAARAGLPALQNPVPVNPKI